MEQTFLSFGKNALLTAMAAIGFNFASPAFGQVAQNLPVRAPINIGEDGDEVVEATSQPDEPIDLLAQQREQAAKLRKVSSEEALDAADKAYGPRKPKPCPVTTDPNEIVVCAAVQDDSEFRVKSSGQLDPNDRSNNDGIPRAGDIAGIAGPGIFTGPATVGGACLPGSCPPEMPIMIDLEAIPEAPAGSDADKIAKGELRVD